MNNHVLIGGHSLWEHCKVGEFLENSCKVVRGCSVLKMLKCCLEKPRA